MAQLQTTAVTGSLTVTGNITAQTLVVQTITSSVSVVTGSTQFGSLTSNTHQFTGSILQSGSLAYFAGSVGIGTTSPSTKLHVNGGNIVVDNSSDVALIFAKNGSSKYEWYLDNASNNFGLYDRGNTAWRIYVNNAGNVGIGTTSPAAPLHVASENNNNDGTIKLGARLWIQHRDGGETTSSFANDYNSDTARMEFRMKANTSAAAKMVILGSGNVGIGSSSPAYKLDVVGGDARIMNSSGPVLNLSDNATRNWDIGLNSSTDAFYIKDGVASSTRLTIDTSGNVGIGVTSPTYLLNVVAGAGTQAIFQAGQSGISNGYTINSNGTNLTHQWYNGSNEAMRLNTSGNLGIGTTSPAALLDITSATAGYAYTSYQSYSGATRWYVGAGNSGVTIQDFGIGTSNIGNSPFFMITSGGNVGIGTTSPSAKLHTYLGASSSTAAANAIAIFEDDTNGVVQINGPDANSMGLFFGRSGSAYYSGIERSGTDLYLKNNSSVAVTINSGGSVGIGTTSPVSKLEVSSTLNASTFTGITVSNGAGGGAEQSRAGIAFKAYDWVQSAIWHGRNISGNLGGALVLGTNPDTSNLTVGGVVGRMWIINNGNVGIGTESPIHKLQVNGSIALNTSIDGSARYYTYPDSNHSWYYDTDIVGSSADVITYYENFLVRYQDSTNVFLINGSGNVGIGTISPGYRLQVNNSVSDGIVMRTTANVEPFFGLQRNSASNGVGVFRLADGGHLYFDNGATGAGQSTKMTILAGGNVGIGSTSPAYKLDVATANDNAMRIINSAGSNNNGLALAVGSGTPWIDFWGSQLDIKYNTSPGSWNSGANRFVTILSGGNVGIGSTSPTENLTVFANSSRFSVTGTSGAAAILIGNQDSAGVNNPAVIYGANGALYIGGGTSWSGGGTLSANVTFADGGSVGIGTTSPLRPLHVNTSLSDNTGIYIGKITDTSPSGSYRIDFPGWRDNNTNPITARIAAVAAWNCCGNFPSAGYPGVRGLDLVFYTNEGWNDVEPIERMRILDNGNVGIGSASPATTLDIAGTLRSTDASAFATSTGCVGIGTTSPGAKLDVIGNITLTNASNPTFTFSSNDSAIINRTGASSGLYLQKAGSTQVVIDSGGNVGIGTTSPLVELHLKDSNKNPSIRIDHSGGGSTFMKFQQFSGWNNSMTFTSAAAYMGIDVTIPLILNQNGQSVGIGTTSPGQKLDVAARIRLRSDGVSSAGAWHTDSSGTENVFVGLQGTSATSAWGVFSNSSWQLTVLNGGSVGIGTTSPATILDLGTSGGADSGKQRFYNYGGASGNRSGTGTDLGGNSYEFSLFFAYGTSDNGRLTIGSLNGTTYSTKVTVLGNGNVGIGTTSPGYKLDVNGTINAAAGNYYRIGGSAIAYVSGNEVQYGNQGGSQFVTISTGTSEKLRIQTDGNVGIGTTSPAHKLEVANSSGGASFRVYDNSANGDYVIARAGSGGFGYCDVGIKGQGYLLGMYTNPQSSGYTGSVGIIYPAQSSGIMANGALVLGSNSTEKMRILSDGNVGIGTTSPAARLQVSGSNNVLNVKGSGSLATSSLFSVDGANGRLFEVSDDLSNSLFSVNTIAGVPVIEAFADYTVKLGLYSSVSGSTMIITGSNVGIGTTSPGAKLEVVGSGYIIKATSTGSDSAYLQAVNGSYSYIAGVATSLGNGFMGMSSNHPLAIVTNNTERLRIDTSGNVGIGTTNPGYKLDIVGTSMRLRDSSNVNFVELAIFGGVYLGGNGTGGIRYVGTSTNDNFALVANNSEKVRIQTNGNVGIGSISPAYALDVTGTIRATGDVIAYSDARVKDNVETITNALTKVTSLRGVSYTRKDSEDKSRKVGVIAQEVLDVLPEVVQQDAEGNYSVAYGNIVGVLIEAIKELKAEINELKNNK